MGIFFGENEDRPFRVSRWTGLELLALAAMQQSLGAWQGWGAQHDVASGND